MAKKEDIKDPKKDSLKSKRESIEAAIKQIKSSFGSGAVMSLGEAKTEKIKVISTGSIGLDAALGHGGIATGRITEIYGNEGSGKTTLALTIIKNAQKDGGMCAFIDAEHALDINYASKIGVNIKELLISQPDNGEQALEIADMLIRSGIDVVVVDSVAALVTKQELEGEMGDVSMGGQARLMSQALRKMTGSISRSGTTVIFINQIRSKIGIMFGNPETTTGGNALKFYSSIRIEVRQKAAVKKGDVRIGHMLFARIAKNRLAPPYKEVEIEIRYGEGIYLDGEIVDNGVLMGILTKSGPWYSYGEKKLAQGREGTIDFLNNNLPIKNEILEKIKNSGDKLIPVLVEEEKDEELIETLDE